MKPSLASAAVGQLALAGLLALACSSGGNGSETNSTPARDTAEPPPEVVEFAEDWPLPGRDYANSRAVLDSPISRDTVEQLEVVWTHAMPGFGSFGNAATTPLIVDEVVYVQDLSSNVHALDRETGEVLWQKEYGLPQIGPNGVALGWGKLFVAKGSEEIAALDAGTGEELWSTSIVASETDGIDIQPTVIGGLVLASTVPISVDGLFQGGDRGVIHALDAETGEVVWKFDTVAGDDVWGNPEINAGGGAWYPPAVDPDSGVVYWGTANPAPFPGTAEYPNGSSRPGPNLYTDSVLALDVGTGELLWYQQATPHDLFDRDLVLVAIADVETGGASHRVVIGTGKLGRVIGHDPASGEVLWDTPVGRHDNDDLEELDGPTDVLPGTFGGVITPPAVAEGVVYVAVVNAPTTLEPDVEALWGSRLGTYPGQVVAIDAADGEVLWDRQIDGDPLGGVLVVNDLVFTGTYRGRIYALDRRTGEIVWQFDAPGGINGSPAAVGDMVVWPVGMADPPSLVAFRLGAGG